MLFLLCWSPIIFMIILAAWLKRSALEISIYSTLFSLLLVATVFNTPLTVALQAALDGVFTTLPLLLVVCAGVFLSNLLLVSGSLSRLVEWFMEGVRNTYHRELLITMGVGNFMEGSSVIAEPVVAPMLYAAGVPPTGAAALAVIGYAGLMTLEMAGIIITVIAIITGLPMYDIGVASAWLSIPAMLWLSIYIPFFLSMREALIRKIALSLGCALIVSLVALVVATYIGFSIAGMMGGFVLILFLVSGGLRNLKLTRVILYDLSPFLFVLIMLTAVNAIPVLKRLTFENLTFSFNLIPVHTITYRPFFSSYVYLFFACLLAIRLIRVSKDQLKTVTHKSLSIGWRVSLTMGLFGALGQILAFSGYQAGFVELEQAYNMPWLIANGIKHYSADYYPIFVPFLGWIGTFLTGYGVASLMLFGVLQLEAAQVLDISAVWLVSGLAVGASVGSISSPFKVAIATPMCNALGREGEILRYTIPLGILASFIVGLVLWMVV